MAGLRNPPGSLGINENLFENKAAYLTSSTTTSPATIVGASASNRAQPGSFQLVVQQLATAQKLSSSSVDTVDQKLQDKFTSFSGTMTLGLVGGASADIAVDGSMTIQDVRNAVNSRSATTGVAATVLQVATGDVRLVLTAHNTGQVITMSNGAGDDVLAQLGLSADGGTTIQHAIQGARTARFTIDGVAIERSSNKIDDALQGVTLNLFKSEPGTTVTVEVERSLEAVKEKVTSLVDAYNAFRDFVSQQSQVSTDGKVSADSPLFANTFLRDMQTKVSTVLGGTATGGTGGSLRDLGITLDASNKMQIDSTKLDSALLTKLDKVRNILEYRFESSSADLALYSRSGPLQDTAFTVSIIDADADGQIESASIDGVGVDVTGKVIKCRDGTAYSGLQFIWAGTGSTSINVKASQGVADKTYDELNKVLDDVQGRLANEVGEIQSGTTKAQAEIDKISERAERYRDQLVTKFSALEFALAQSKAMLQQIRASLGQTSNN